MVAGDAISQVGGDLLTLVMASDTDPLPPGIRIVHLDTSAWEIGKNFPTAVPRVHIESRRRAEERSKT